MTLIVEDDTGRLDAEAYVAVAPFKAYCDGRGLSYAGQTDTQIEVALRRATDWIDTSFRYKGARLVAAQALEFPRAGMTDHSGYDVAGVPARVKRACNELAFRALTETLTPDLDRGGRVTSESIGPISVTYADDAPAGKTIRIAENLLAPYVRADGDTLTGPFFSTSDAPAFEAGSMDNIGATSETEA